jgi:hypothetical protein
VYPVDASGGERFSAWTPALDATKAADATRLTFSEVPIVRADWFFTYTSANVDRRAGYYKFLGIKSKDDIAELVGLDVAKARKIQREVAAIIAESGVALNNRQIYRFGAIAGGVWFTFDVKTSKDRQNAIRQLNGDFTDNADANEVYFSLPNRLWGLAAVNNKEGTLQESVPDFIASDSQSTSNDRRIHPSISCIRCHVEGLRPINDYARQFYTIDPKEGGALLTSPDYAKFKRLQRLYLGDLESEYQADQLVYSRALVRLLGPGWTPEKVAVAVRNTWQNYLDTPVSPEQLALELGCTVPMMQAAFSDVSVAKGANGDPIIIGYARRKTFAARREHIEENFSQMMLAIQRKAVP